MANGKDMKGTGVGNDYVWKQGLADPRTGEERIAGLVNRVLSGNANAPVRKWDDSPAKMAENRAKSKK